MRQIVSLAVAVAALATSPVAGSQTIEIRVTDPDARPVQDVPIEIAAIDGEAFLTRATSSALGLASFELPSAKRAYRLTIEANEWARFEQTFDLGEQRIARGDTVRLAVTVSPPDASERFNRGVRQLQASEIAAAEPEFRRAVELDPEFGRGWAVLAMTLVALERPQEALDAADRAVALVPADVDAATTRYEALVALGHSDDAESALDAIAALEPSPKLARLLFNAGANAANADQPDRAQRRLDQALAHDPQLWQAHAALAELEIRAQRLDPALDAIARALEVAPTEPRLWRRKLDLLRALGREDEAAAVESRLAALEPAE